MTGLAVRRENEVFRKSVEQGPVSNSYVFYDGPPFATGLPHYGHVLISIIKDTIVNWTMGNLPDWRGAWDEYRFR